MVTTAIVTFFTFILTLGPWGTMCIVILQVLFTLEVSGALVAGVSLVYHIALHLTY